MMAIVTAMPSAAASLVRWWTALYTLGLPAPTRERRLREIESDLFELQHDVHRGEIEPMRVCVEIAARLLFGVPDDLAWRWEHRWRDVRRGPAFWSLTTATLLACAASASILLSTDLPARLAGTRWSGSMSESRWLFPIVEGVHVCSICAFVGLSAMLDLRALGLTMRRMRVAEVADAFLPWMTAGFGLTIVTGALVFLGDPTRYAANGFFRFKLALLVIAGLNAWGCHARLYRRADRSGDGAARQVRARIAAVASLTLWAAIVVAGRFIAYIF